MTIRGYCAKCAVHLSEESPKPAEPQGSEPESLRCVTKTFDSVEDAEDWIKAQEKPPSQPKSEPELDSPNFRPKAKQALKIDVVLDVLLSAQCALFDYVERLEKAGGSMNYGRSVLRKIEQAIQLLEERQ